MGKPGLLRGQFRVLARSWPDLGDFRETQPEQIRLLRAFSRPGGYLRELGVDRNQRGIELRVRRERFGHRPAGIPIQRLALPGRSKKPPLVALAVDGNQIVGKFGQYPHRH
jgi:hypothetical protein